MPAERKNVKLLVKVAFFFFFFFVRLISPGVLLKVLLLCRECSGSPKRRIHRNVQQESKSESVKRKWNQFVYI